MVNDLIQISKAGVKSNTLHVAVVDILIFGEKAQMMDLMVYSLRENSYQTAHMCAV